MSKHQFEVEAMQVKWIFRCMAKRTKQVKNFNVFETVTSADNKKINVISLETDHHSAASLVETTTHQQKGNDRNETSNNRQQPESVSYPW